MFHTALVFRQDLPQGDPKHWTLEFDFIAFSALNILDTFIPKLKDGKLSWDHIDARWCLREGILHGREHWTKSYEDVATLSGPQFNQIFTDYIPRFNSSEAGAWPQYQFLRIQDESGSNLIEDTTCSDVWRVLQYARDTLKVPLKNMTYKVSRATMIVKDMVTEKTFNDQPVNPLVNLYFRSMRQQLETPNHTAIALAEFFLPKVPFVHDNNRKQYFHVTGGSRYIAKFFEARYEEVKPLRDEPPEKTLECGLSMKCQEAMTKACRQETDRRGISCNMCLDFNYPRLVLSGHCPLVDTLQSAQQCFCGERMASSSVMV